MVSVSGQITVRASAGTLGQRDRQPGQGAHQEPAGPVLLDGHRRRGLDEVGVPLQSGQDGCRPPPLDGQPYRLPCEPGQELVPARPGPHCPVVVGIKEIPPEKLVANQTYVFFSHTIKGQPHNMPMLRRLMELNCQLIDFERITDAEGRRLVFFGRFAGLAGMIDTLWAFGRRLRHEGVDSPFASLRQAYGYENLEVAKAHVAEIMGRLDHKFLNELDYFRDSSPSSENIACYVAHSLQELLDVPGVRVSRVTAWESDDASATYIVPA